MTPRPTNARRPVRLPGAWIDGATLRHGTAASKPHSVSAKFPGTLIGNSTLLANPDAPDQQQASGQCATEESPIALSYSYHTCGIVDTFTVERGLLTQIEVLRSRAPLRLSIPGDEPPYTTTAGENSSDFVSGTSRRGGSVVRFVTDMLAEYDLSWVCGAAHLF